MRNEFKLQVTVPTGDLIIRLKENREKHTADYKEAVDGYRRKAINLLQRKLREVEESLDLNKVPEVDVVLHHPVSYENSYTSVIGMLEMHTGDSITIDAGVYNCYVQDKWDWTGSFKRMSESYK
jgi:hypothetical protein